MPPYAGSSSNALYAAGGAAAGAGAYALGAQISSAKKRATISLGIGIGIAGLLLVNSGNLNTCSATAQSLAQQANNLTLSAGTAASGVDGSNLRSLFVQGQNNQALIAYYANPFNFFSTMPTAQPSTVQLAAVPNSVVASSGNSNLAPVLLIGLGVAAVAFAG